MKLFVGVTDDKWFEFLAQNRPDEINFWLPTGNQAFRALTAGAPFLFKLHSPRNFVVGGGFFVSYSALPLSIAWQTFGEKNGSSDFAASVSKSSNIAGVQKILSQIQQSAASF